MHNPLTVAVLALAAASPWLPCRTTASPLPAETRQIERVRGPDGKYARQLVRAPLPQVGDHEVLVHVRAVSIQRGDIDDEEAAGFMDLDHGPDLSHRPVGSDAAGDVVSVGRLVKGIRPGQRVASLIFPGYLEHPFTPTTMDHALGLTVRGVFADYAVLRDDGVAPIPDYLTYEEAATLPSSAVTAWEALGIDEHWTRRGSTVLVEGTGGVSSFALVFAVAAGATVIVTSSSDEKLQKARSLGAVGLVNYRSHPAWSEQVRELTGGHGADVVVDMGGRSTLDQSVKSLAYEGSLAIVGGLGGYDGVLPAMGMIEKVAVARGVFGGSRADFLRMCRFMERHRVHPVISHVYAFDDYQQAFGALKSGNVFGKIVLVLQ
jgi:NADPH:quinone reductase-like Zn-dependent oxidoreductase